MRANTRRNWEPWLGAVLLSDPSLLLCSPDALHGISRPFGIRLIARLISGTERTMQGLPRFCQPPSGMPILRRREEGQAMPSCPPPLPISLRALTRGSAPPVPLAGTTFTALHVDSRLVRPAVCGASLSRPCRAASPSEITLRRCAPRYLAEEGNCQGGSCTHRRLALRGTPTSRSVLPIQRDITVDLHLLSAQSTSLVRSWGMILFMVSRPRPS